MPETALHSDYRQPRQVRTYTITELCDEFGVTARALRFYEDEGLIAPQRQGLARIYSLARSCAPGLDPPRQEGRLLALRDPRDDRPLRCRRRPRRPAPADARKMPRPGRPARQAEGRHRRHDRRARALHRDGRGVATSASPANLPIEDRRHAQLYRSGRRHALRAGGGARDRALFEPARLRERHARHDRGDPDRGRPLRRGGAGAAEPRSATRKAAPATTTAR